MDLSAIIVRLAKFAQAIAFGILILVMMALIAGTYHMHFVLGMVLVATATSYGSTVMQVMAEQAQQNSMPKMASTIEFIAAVMWLAALITGGSSAVIITLSLVTW